MFVYLSTFTGTGVPFIDPFRPTAFAEITAEGGQGACFDLRADCTQVAGRALVGSTIQLATIPPGVTFLLDTNNLDTNVPDAVVNQANSQLGTNIPTGITWRQVFRRLAKIEGRGKWGQVIGDILHFGAAGELPI